MAKKPFMNMVGVNCPPELEDKLNKWYDDTHVRMIMDLGMVNRAVRYRRVDTDAKVATGEIQPPLYLATYDFDDQATFEKYWHHPDHEPLNEDVRQTWPNWADMRKLRAQYEVMRIWTK